MKKQQLEIALQRLKPLEKRSAALEQYSTPASIAADILWEANRVGDIEGRAVADLGCGNGVFAIGAMLLGARRSVGIDSDNHAVDVAVRNALEAGTEVEFQCADVRDASGEYDTVVQNPPFGAQTKHADRPFIEKALELAPRVYSLHNSDTQEFVVDMVAALGATCEPVKRFKFEIPYAFAFHRKPKETISVVLLKFRR